MKPHLTHLFAAFLSLSAGANSYGKKSASSSAACERACSRIASNSTSPTYNPGNGNLTVWDAKQQEIQSACRVVPLSPEEVSKALRITVEKSCRFAIKGGGHARYPDDSVSVGGVTIDLQRMRSIYISPDRETVKLGSGHTLRSLYHGLDQHNLTTLGGRAGSVGLGGYTLGGDLSHLSPKFGLAMDNVFEYELVLPNGTAAVVDENTHPDLYFALRGGMNNFGIVTHFTMRAVPQGQYHAGLRTYTMSKRDAIIEQAYKLTTEWKNDTDMSFYYDFGYNQTTDTYTVSITPEYSRPIMSPAPFVELKRIPYESDTIRLGNATEFSDEVASGTPPGNRNLFATVTYFPSQKIDREVQNVMMEELESVKTVTGFHPNLVLQPLYESTIRAGRQRGENAAGIEADGPLTVVLLTVLWENSSDDDAMNGFVARWIEKVNAFADKQGKRHPWLYINYASNQQDPFAGYGEENVRRLQHVQKSVDPEGVFTSTGLCRGYFKLL